MKAFFFAIICTFVIAIDPNQQQIQVGLGPSDYVTTGAETQFSEGEMNYCEIIDSCRTCTFAELQQIAACQKTGFRMILKCTTALVGSKDNVDETYHDRPCSEAQTSLSSLERGKYAEFGSGPMSVSKFCALIVLLTTIAYCTLS